MRCTRSVLLFLLAMALAAPLWAESESEPGQAPEANYLPLESFVVNLQAEGRRVHFMQVSVQVMTHEESVVEAIKSHLPPVRDALIMLLSHQSTQSMGNVEGREKIRREAQEAIQQVLAEASGIDEGVDAVYFTDFVIQ